MSFISLCEIPGHLDEDLYRHEWVRLEMLWLPPENELQKGCSTPGGGGERVMSEHQLRVQRSLQKLNVPDWYKQNQVPREGFLLETRKKSNTSAGGGLTGGVLRESARWQQQHHHHHTPQQHNTHTAASSKTTSLSSLGSNNSATYATVSGYHQQHNSPPQMLSPSHGGQQQPFVRWSTSKLNSTASSPCASTRSSFNASRCGGGAQSTMLGGTTPNQYHHNGSISPSSLRSSFTYRTPYLGWRSQERLSRPRTPAERLANSLLQDQRVVQQVVVDQRDGGGDRSDTVTDSPEIQTSIKEVTSAIVHYVSGLRPEDTTTAPIHSRSSSPHTTNTRGSHPRLCWLESSFVGTRPLDSPQTPVTLTTEEDNSATTSTSNTQQPAAVSAGLRLDLQQRSTGSNNDMHLLSGDGSRKPSPGSTTLEDVLDSLLGLPSSTRAPSPSLQETESANISPIHGYHRPHHQPLLQQQQQQQQQQQSHHNNTNHNHNNTKDQQYRRRSDGSDISTTRHHTTTTATVIDTSSTPRRVSLNENNHSSSPSPTAMLTGHSTTTVVPLVRCRYSRCPRLTGGAASVTAANNSTATGGDSSSSSVGGPDAGTPQAFKRCHNCTYTYCSRACRRAHWEKHRKTCLFSRVGTLCRRVIAAVKERPDTLLHLSVIARRGFLSHGAGTVKLFFPCAEAAERFLSAGLPSLGTPTYLRWPDLLPTEMGTQLYTELVHMCRHYNVDAKLVLYVSVCVVSEAPAAGAVKWERQLVSRCGKMRLSKDTLLGLGGMDGGKGRGRSVGDGGAAGMEVSETVVLVSVQEGGGVGGTSKVQRQLTLDRIQAEFCSRGVSLRRQYSDIYSQLLAHVDTGHPFPPATVYPRDTTTGRTFMCIIMPDATADCIEKVALVTGDGAHVRTIDLATRSNDLQPAAAAMTEFAAWTPPALSPLLPSALILTAVTELTGAAVAARNVDSQ